MNTLASLCSQFLGAVTIIKVTDILDILIVTFLIYKVLSLSKTRSAGQIVKVVILLLVLSYASSFLGLNVLNFVLSRVLEVGLIALVVVFQPELRRIMERLGGSSLRSMLIHQSPAGDSLRTLEQTVEACRTMSNQKIGVLIVFERQDNLEEYFGTGTVVNADVSEELLKNIFFPKAALHDGAVVIRSDRVAAAGCVLPLTENPNLSRELGTRHRAAIGITERSDAVVVVVSEETGVISCAAGGSLRRYLTPETLMDYLKQELTEEETPNRGRLLSFLRWLRFEKDEVSNDEE